MPVIRTLIKSPVVELKTPSHIKISRNHDESVLTGNTKTTCGTHITHWKGTAIQTEDLLIYGYFNLSTIPAAIGFTIIVLAIADTARFIASSFSNIDIEWILLTPLAIALFITSRRIPANRFIIFDRKNQITHIPAGLGNKCDTIKWADTSFYIYDENYVYRPHEYSHTRITIMPPPFDAASERIPSPYGRRKLKQLSEPSIHHYESAEAEAIYRYIVRFMNRSEDGDSQFGSTDRLPLLLDTTKLPKKPNWIRHPNGRWERTVPGTVIRKTLFDGLPKSKGNG
ncbi:hypothetical protein [Ectothiorhodospira lacustris]|uniref:hypothetical protein n=1 Tax=Ectothiorhodospira lacustris TaxID=2899127 RepID=UPI001EE8E70F|nr:hypothetical protein [Ectothiorhodospira lacustris]MCG5509578.1 hypothetical protein [Ectothiorhodospira lacustris]MCG5521627.1 hypothetical protein [Ectothiorhodospira lacustris]